MEDIKQNLSEVPSQNVATNESGATSSVSVHGMRIIPSDTFTIGNNKYILMNILETSGGIINLEITGMAGQDTAKTAVVPLIEFENANPINFSAIFNQRLKGERKEKEIQENGLEKGEREKPVVPVDIRNHRPQERPSIREEENHKEIPEIAYLQPRDGVVHVLQRQIEQDEYKMELLPGDDSFQKAMRLAQKFGYLDDSGKEIRVIHRRGVAYVLSFENGKPVVKEYLGGIEDNTNPIEIQNEKTKRPEPKLNEEKKEFIKPETKEIKKGDEELPGASVLTKEETKTDLEKMSDKEIIQTRGFLLPDTENISLSPNYIRAIFEIEIDKLLGVMPKFPSQIRDVLGDKKPAQIVEEMGAKEILEKNKIEVNEIALTKLAYIARALRDMNPGLEEKGKTIYEFVSSKINN